MTNELDFDSVELMETIQASYDRSDLENLMGERSKDGLRLDYDRKLKFEFHGTKVTSDAGLLAYRELDEVLGLTTMIESELTDSRTGKNTQHGLLPFNQYGDMEQAFLRNGNVRSADDWQSVLEPIIARYRASDIPRFFRGDAGFADPEIYRFLESEDYFYAIRMKGNQILYNKIEHLLTRPAGRPPKKPNGKRAPPRTIDGHESRRGRLNKHPACGS